MYQKNIHKPTRQENDLYKALIDKGVKAEQGYWDGHKHVDIAILDAHIYIEVDGNQHFTDPIQIERDFKRYHYSDGDDFNTFYVPNNVIEEHLDEVANALYKVVEGRIINPIKS